MLWNAWLTAIAAGGSAEEWDGPSAAGPSKWAGRVRAEWRQSRSGLAGKASAQTATGADNSLTQRVLIISGDLRTLPVVDDVVTFELDDTGETITGAVATVDGPRGSRLIARHLRTIRVKLKDQ